MQYKRTKRHINGVLLLDKPPGFSSNQALQRVKHLFTAAKAGHTGNLDPFATGLLPICFGDATKFSHTLLDADKVYRAVLKLGVTTSTGDTEGEMTARRLVNVTRQDVQKAVACFHGRITQIPPMHSALKHQGKPLYEYARAGIDIERKPREVIIHQISLENFAKDEVEILVRCSKGTYIRVLAEDIGNVLGCGAHLIVLQRLETGGFHIRDSYTLPQLESLTDTDRDRCVLPVDFLLLDLAAVELDDESARCFCRGQVVWKSGVHQSGMLRVYAPNHVFLGVAENLEDGTIAPRRVLDNALKS